MMHKWDEQLKPGYHGNPVVEVGKVSTRGLRQIEDDDLLAIFKDPGKHSLKTWGRKPGTKELDPHWIAVCKQTPLHSDPAYPRYTHQIMLRVDDFALRGVSKEETPLVRGTYFVCHTHSPHQLFAKSKDARWYVGVSVDWREIIPQEIVIPMLLDYSRSAEFLTADIVLPNNGGRFALTA